MENVCLYRKMLIATDLSEATSQVIDCVNRMGGLFCQEVMLLHVVSGKNGSSDRSVDMETAISSQTLALKAAGLNASYSFAYGEPSQVIAKFVQEKKYQFLVIGSRGKSKVRGMFLGSTAGKIIESVTVPTLLIKNMSPEVTGCPLDFTGRFLFLTDFSQNADIAFENLLLIAPYFGASVTLFNVQDQSRLIYKSDPGIEESSRQDMERLLSLQRRLHEQGVKNVTIKVEYGFPKKTIMKEIRSEKYGLVVLGTQGKDWMEEWLLGSIAHAVTRLSNTSLLLVPNFK